VNSVLEMTQLRRSHFGFFGFFFCCCCFVVVVVLLVVFVLFVCFGRHKKEVSTALLWSE